MLVALALTALAVAGPLARAEVSSQVFVTAYQYFPADEDYTVTNGDQVITPLVVSQGGSINLTNLDVLFPQAHSMTADLADANEIPIFDTQLVPGGDSAFVAGVELLSPGVYRFHCRQHDVMYGYLQVV